MRSMPLRLTTSYFGDDLLSEVQCRVGHAAAEARGADCGDQG